MSGPIYDCTRCGALLPVEFGVNVYCDKCRERHLITWDGVLYHNPEPKPPARGPFR